MPHMERDISPQIESLRPITAQTLLLTPLAAVIWIVVGLIARGLIVLAGAPKSGKTWMLLDLALCVSTGQPFLGFDVVQCGVLYLSLEDTEARIQQRLFRLTNEANDNLHFVTTAKTLHGGLLDQLDNFIEEHPDTKLIILDTFQVARGATGEPNYSLDYEDMRLLKRFADERCLTVLVVHHTRKMADDSNVFNTISGSNGIIGAADESLVLTKANFADSKAALSVVGRDVDMAEYKLDFKDCRWELIEKTSRKELKERHIPAEVLAVVDFMASQESDWQGTATRLLESAEINTIKGNVLSKFLNEHKEFLYERGIELGARRTPSERLILLTKLPDAKIEESECDE